MGDLETFLIVCIAFGAFVYLCRLGMDGLASTADRTGILLYRRANDDFMKV